MITEAKKAELEMGFLAEALVLAHEVVGLRVRLVDAQREHAQVLGQREERLAEGIDVLPEIRGLFRDIESLPAQISEMEERARRIVEQNVEHCNSKMNRQAIAAYMANRDALRQAAQQFRGVLANVTESMQRSAFEGAAFVEPINPRLAQIERVLNTGPLPRTVFRLSPLPIIDATAVARGEWLGALDRWISSLH